MIWRSISLALFVAVIAPELLHAQIRPLTKLEAKVTIFDFDKMYEDIEIFRRILDRKLYDLYPKAELPHNQRNLSSLKLNTGNYLLPEGAVYRYTVDSQVSEIAQATRSTLEGFYTPGQGIVYTATLSSLHLPEKAGKAETAKPVSEWDSVRRQVRNEKEEPKKAEAAKPSALDDVLLKILIENGRNFSHLNENEILTIVITVRQTNSSSRKSKGGGGSGDSPKKAPSKPKSDDGSDFPGKDLALLGEMHMRQGQYGEAIKEFVQVFKLQPDLNARQKIAPALYRKLAQCYLALGQDEKAQKMLDEIKSLLKEPVDLRSRLTASDKPAAALPVKLIVSASKKLLQQAQEGKIAFEEFRRQARVETVGGANSSR